LYKQVLLPNIYNAHKIQETEIKTQISRSFATIMVNSDSDLPGCLYSIMPNVLRTA